ncbi:MAG TPA: hypothetical protein VL098_14225 [Flavipsychrobacter sp.]|nr:hypothetical protein [Flavipsychrobacter sp.]
MKKGLSYIVASALFLSGILVPVHAIGDKKGKGISSITPYLSNSGFSGGLIPKKVFDSLIKQGITARDSSGMTYKVVEFTFGYGERNIYEDSVGRPTILTDYFSEICHGDTLSTTFKNFIFKDNRSKHGDTVYFDKIRVALPEGGTIITKSTRFVLTK